MTLNEMHSNNGELEEMDQNSEQNSQEQENSYSEQRTQPMTEAEKAASIADLLNGQDEGDIDDEDEDVSSEETDLENTEEENNSSLTLSDIAEKLDIGIDELYRLNINTGDGETVSLGELKDAFQNRAKAERESAEREATLDSREAAVIADQQVWSILAQSGQLPKQAVRAAYEQLQNVVARETDTLFQLVPELQDEVKLDSFRRDMVNVLSQVGYKPHEVMLTDHRQALFIKRFIQQEKELKRLKELTKPQAPKAGKPNGRGSKPNTSAFISKARNGTEASKVAAVERLITGG